MTTTTTEMHRSESWKVVTIVLVLLACAVLGAFTTKSYVKARGWAYLQDGLQFKRHERILNGVAGNPRQYRVLSAYLVEGTIRLAGKAGIPRFRAFIFFRFAQDLAIFFVAVLFYRKLGISLPLAMIGIMILAWGTSNSHYDSDLSFNSFFDVLFYLLAGLAILSRRHFWIPVIVVLAALNRETSGLIPFLYLAVALLAAPAEERTKGWIVFGLSMGLYVVVFVGLRLAYGPQELFIPYGHAPGLSLLSYNLFRGITWWNALATVGVIPFLAIANYRNWPDSLRIFFWVLVPLWGAVHLFASVLAESRLLLVPEALVLIPGALMLVKIRNETKNS